MKSPGGRGICQNLRRLQAGFQLGFQPGCQNILHFNTYKTRAPSVVVCSGSNCVCGPEYYAQAFSFALQRARCLFGSRQPDAVKVNGKARQNTEKRNKIKQKQNKTKRAANAEMFWCLSFMRLSLQTVLLSDCFIVSLLVSQITRQKASQLAFCFVPCLVPCSCPCSLFLVPPLSSRFIVWSLLFFLYVQWLLLFFPFLL